MFKRLRKIKNLTNALGVWFCVALIGCGKAETLTPLASSLVGSRPAILKIQIKNYTPSPGKTLQHLFVSNFSAKIKKGEMLKSFARDGLYDRLKTTLNPNYGFLLTGPETVVTGYSDLALYFLGIKSPQQLLVYCSASQFNSTSRDQLVYNDQRQSGNPQQFLGLRDCEKNYMGLDPNRFNFSGDGIPDYLKMTCGLNPLNPYDAYLSTSGDGVANIDKCKRHIPIDEDSRTDANQIFAYKYEIKTLSTGVGEFEISNIPIFNDDENFIAFYVVEVDMSDNTQKLYTAYAIVPPGYDGKTLQFDWWSDGTAARQVNQKITVPPPAP